MRSISYVIIEVEKQYNNEKILKNGVSLILNTTIESVPNINRIAKVVCAPKDSVVEEGDLVLFHHNILRKKYNMSGVLSQSDYHFKDNLFYVPIDLVYMYKRGDEWKAIEPFCFIKPIKDEGLKTTSNLIIPNFVKTGYKGLKENRGIVEFGNQDLIDIGVNEGDEVVFKRDREYEFMIDGEILYKMCANDVLGILETAV